MSEKPKLKAALWQSRRLYQIFYGDHPHPDEWRGPFPTEIAVIQAAETEAERYGFQLIWVYMGSGET